MLGFRALVGVRDMGWPLGWIEEADTTGPLPSWGDRPTGSYCLAWKAEVMDVVVMIEISEDCGVS